MRPTSITSTRHQLPAAILLSLAAVSAQAEKSVSSWQEIFRGVSFAQGVETDVLYPGEATAARRLAVSALRIDLDAPGVLLLTTPGNGSLPLDTTSQTTGAFLTEHRLQVAVNAGFFSPCCAALAQPKDVIGLAISNGSLVSPADDLNIPPGGRADSLVIDAANTASITRVNPGDDVSGYHNAVSAGPVLLRDGAITVSLVPPSSFADKNPRTAAGLSGDGNTLLLLTIDGRQPGYSDGATLYETGDWLRWLGADDGLNLDGGGSTTMVMANHDGSALLLNRPSGSAQRYNGNNLGVFASPVPEPMPSALLALGLVALTWLGRRRAVSNRC